MFFHLLEDRFLDAGMHFEFEFNLLKDLLLLFLVFASLTLFEKLFHSLVILFKKFQRVQLHE